MRERRCKRGEREEGEIGEGERKGERERVMEEGRGG